jgi:pimeloyl-ACP methyl ester carboxylesterase
LRRIVVLEHYLSVFIQLVSMVAALLVAPSTAPVEVAARQAAPPPRFHEARLPSGVRLRYVDQGPTTGPAVLMLHGYTDSWFSFSRVLPLMPAGTRVIVPDQRGHGQSDRPDHGYAMDDLATDALQLMDLLQVRTVTVVGHSMGSFVARRVAEKAPARVTRLVLMGSAPVPMNAGLRELRTAVNELTDPVDAAFARGFQESTVMKPVPAAFMNEAIDGSLSVPARVWKSALAGLMAYVPTGAPACPTLVLGGAGDSVFSRKEQEDLAASIPGASLEIIEGIGHTLHWEDPERFVASLARFLGDR